jgi:hypothetical protein
VFVYNCRAKEKEAAKEKRKNERLSGAVSTTSRKELKNNTMAASNCKITVVVDLSFDDKMDKRVISLYNYNFAVIFLY